MLDKFHMPNVFQLLSTGAKTPEPEDPPGTCIWLHE